MITAGAAELASLKSHSPHIKGEQQKLLESPTRRNGPTQSAQEKAATGHYYVGDLRTSELRVPRPSRRSA